MTEEAKRASRLLRRPPARGADEDAPVPVTARKLEALVRLAEASARIRLSDTVDEADADRAVDIAHCCLRRSASTPKPASSTPTWSKPAVEDSARPHPEPRRHHSDIEDEYDEGAPPTKSSTRWMRSASTCPRTPRDDYRRKRGCATSDGSPSDNLIGPCLALRLRGGAGRVRGRVTVARDLDGTFVGRSGPMRLSSRATCRPIGQRWSHRGWSRRPRTV